MVNLIVMKLGAFRLLPYIQVLWFFFCYKHVIGTFEFLQISISFISINLNGFLLFILVQQSICDLFLQVRINIFFILIESPCLVPCTQILIFAGSIFPLDIFLIPIIRCIFLDLSLKRQHLNFELIKQILIFQPELSGHILYFSQKLVHYHQDNQYQSQTQTLILQFSKLSKFKLKSVIFTLIMTYDIQWVYNLSDICKNMRNLKLISIQLIIELILQFLELPILERYPFQTNLPSLTGLQNILMNRSVSPTYIQKLVTIFKRYLARYNNTYAKAKPISGSSYYEIAKIAETQQRDLVRAMELYIDAIKHGQKKDSSIKDFASSLHQLGFTLLAIQFLNDVQIYYDGDLNKYRRLRGNFELQLRPTGKHECKFLLIQGITQELKELAEQEIPNELFAVSKRIKNVYFLKNFNMTYSCNKKKSNNILFQFQSFSAAKKTLESFRFDQWFGLNIYWVNSQRDIVCGADDGRKEFQQGNVITAELIRQRQKLINHQLWVAYGEDQYKNRKNKGFSNLLASRIIKQKEWQKLIRIQRQKKQEKIDIQKN